MHLDGMSMTSLEIKSFAAMSITSSQIKLTDIMEVDESTAHDRNDLSPRTIGVNERTAAPPHRVNEVLDQDVAANDVLAGRGGRAENHRGNKYYLESVSLKKIESQTTDDNEVKKAIPEAIVKHILEQNGRFFKAIDAHSWSVMEFDEARKKTSQALRETSRVMVRAIENV